MIEKSCSKCGEIKMEDKFIQKRNICKECRNKHSREIYKALEIIDENQKKCNQCNQEKTDSSFIKKLNLCKDCNNENRRNRYLNDENYRLKAIKSATLFKQNRLVKNKIKKEEEIGKDTKKCNYCFQIKFKDNFRYNRLKCKDCERDDPIDKFKRSIRCRIYLSLKKKNNHTIEYLGCTFNEYNNWMLIYNNNYTLGNHGKDWHIDHVIPLSKFNLENEEEQLIAFNWRNTMPLSIKENLSKNNKILKPQIEEHLKKLLKYHKDYELEMPQKIIDLFVKHLDAGTPLEPVLSNK